MPGPLRDTYSLARRCDTPRPVIPHVTVSLAFIVSRADTSLLLTHPHTRHSASAPHQVPRAPRANAMRPCRARDAPHTCAPLAHPRPPSRLVPTLGVRQTHHPAADARCCPSAIRLLSTTTTTTARRQGPALSARARAAEGGPGGRPHIHTQGEEGGGGGGGRRRQGKGRSVGVRRSRTGWGGEVGRMACRAGARTRPATRACAP